MFENVDNIRMTEAYSLYYKLIYEPKSSGELKKNKERQGSVRVPLAPHKT